MKNDRKSSGKNKVCKLGKKSSVVIQFQKSFVFKSQKSAKSQQFCKSGDTADVLALIIICCQFAVKSRDGDKSGLGSRTRGLEALFGRLERLETSELDSQAFNLCFGYKFRGKLSINILCNLPF